MRHGLTRQNLTSRKRKRRLTFRRLRFRLVLVCIVFLAATTAALAEAPPEREPTKLTISPAAAASPALKYVLLPELSDQTPGNAALEYYRAFSPEWWANIRQPKSWEKINNALQAPLKDFPRKDVQWLEGNKMLQHVDSAARREYVDWGMGERIRREGYALLLPDIQGLRNFATLLGVRARLEIAEGRYDKAVYTLQTGLALARHAGDSVTLIQSLVGIAVAQIMFAQMEELIQQPGAPNLYWALTDLPRPFSDLHKALQGEKFGLYAVMPELHNLETTRLTEEQQQKLLPALGGGLERMVFNAGQKPEWGYRLAGTLLVLRAYPEAKQALIAAGRKPEEVEALPTLQVVLIHSWRQYRQLQDDEFKCANLPFWEARVQLAKLDERFRQSRRRLEAMPFLDFLPAIQKVFAAAVRTDRRIAALRCIEAIRIYAAAHDGELPESLDAIEEVPIPIDPATGKAFTYRVSGERAMLIAPPPPREDAHVGNSLFYELTLRRKK